METPKDKAEILTDKYFNLFAVDLENTISKYEAVECAKIAIEEILDFQINKMKWSEEHNGNVHFWQEVKTELNKL